MYISNVKISNYRNLRNIDVELAQTVTIIGSNNSGKSNLLKAITLPFLADEIAYVGKNLTWFDINNSAKNDYYQFLIDNKESILTDKVTLEDFKKQIPKIKIEVNIIPKKMLMCGKVTHKNLIDSSPLFRYYSLIWIEKTSLIQYNKTSRRCTPE